MGSQPPMPVRMPGRVAGAERGKVPRGEWAWLSGCVLPSAGTYRSCTRVSPGRDSACLGGRSAGTVLHMHALSLVGLDAWSGGPPLSVCSLPRPRSVSAACGRLSLR